jgi:hypothetical protein
MYHLLSLIAGAALYLTYLKYAVNDPHASEKILLLDSIHAARPPVEETDPTPYLAQHTIDCATQTLIACTMTPDACRGFVSWYLSEVRCLSTERLRLVLDAADSPEDYRDVLPIVRAWERVIWQPVPGLTERNESGDLCLSTSELSRLLVADKAMLQPGAVWGWTHGSSMFDS